MRARKTFLEVSVFCTPFSYALAASSQNQSMRAMRPGKLSFSFNILLSLSVSVSCCLLKQSVLLPTEFSHSSSYRQHWVSSSDKMRIDCHWTSCKAAYIHTHYWFLCFYWFLRLFFGLFGLCLHRCLCGLPNCSSFFSGLWFHGQNFGLLRHHNFMPFSYLCAPPGPPEQLSCKNGRASLSEKKEWPEITKRCFLSLLFFFFFLNGCMNDNKQKHSALHPCSWRGKSLEFLPWKRQQD